MTLKDLFDAFLALIESDEWEAVNEGASLTEEEQEAADKAMDEDLLSIAKAAKPWFKFPRCSINWDETAVNAGENADKVNFIKANPEDPDITNTEIQILAAFMKMIWYGRVIDSWENLRPLYTERDFSPGKMLAEFKGRAADQKKNALDLERVYYRSINGKPFDFSRLAGG